ncbi:MAG: homoserine dehydrogenase [Nannocystaceae bacterium]
MSREGRAPQALEVAIPELTLAGRRLRGVVLRGYVSGAPLGSAPVIMLVGGITASPFPFGDGEGQPGWWPALLGEGLVDLEAHTVVSVAWPGNGSTWIGLEGGGEGEGAELPALSASDLADLVALWLEGIGCERPVLYLGASMGGLVGLALASRHPARVARLVTISAGLRPDGWGTGVRHLQRQLVLDGLRNGDAFTGMVRARQLGMLTYRGRDELDTRFEKLGPDAREPGVAAYLDHHGRRFAERFPARTFLLLSEAIDRFDLSEGTGSFRQALERVRAEVVVVGVPGDLLFPYALQGELHRELQAAGAHSSLWKLESRAGHDAFLADQERLAGILRDSGIFREPQGPPRPRYEGVGAQPLRRIGVGLIGCGVVGQGLLELLRRQEASLAERFGVRFEVPILAVRDLGKDRGPHARTIEAVTDPQVVVAHPAVDVVVEVAGGVESMAPVLTAALASGKAVVTANKALLARKLGELGTLAHRTGTPLACEASAAAALPIFRHLSHRADEVRSLLAIVNGTSNYILTRLEQDESTLAEAIAAAQALGLAEADPSADLDGHDAAAKLSLLAYRSFGAWVRPDDFRVRGIRELTPADCDLAEAMGFKIRHLARAAWTGAPKASPLGLAVEPVLLPGWHLLANVEEEYNAVYLSYESAGDLSLFGKGAGGLPTATAVLGDLIDLAQGNSARWPVPSALEVGAAGDERRRHYLRVTGEHHPTLEARALRHLRRGGMVVQDRASRADKGGLHLAFMVSASAESALAEVTLGIQRLGRVEATLSLGVLEG